WWPRQVRGASGMAVGIVRWRIDGHDPAGRAQPPDRPVLALHGVCQTRYRLNPDPVVLAGRQWRAHRAHARQCPRFRFCRRVRGLVQVLLDTVADSSGRLEPLETQETRAMSPDAVVFRTGLEVVRLPATS